VPITLRQWLKNRWNVREDPDRCRYNTEDYDNQGCDPEEVEDNEIDLLLATDSI
jgi:hypothetical protein